MKIAIVHPHPVPFAVGGAENLWWGVQRHIVERTGHSCDLVTMGSPEGDFWGLVEAYRSFAQKDLSGYDLVISGKYPAWMVNHPNHVVFLQHRLRGLYDTYPLTPLQERQMVLDATARETMAWMDAMRRGPLGPAQAAELLTHLEALRRQSLGAETTAFPGPFSKAVVHFLDDCALNPRSIRRFLTQSRLVRDRLDYFPPRVDVSVVYPPPHRDDYFCAGDDYLFTSSRLDPIKRIDQIILAMREVDADVPLLIAGTGPDEARLRALAGDDPRIRFLGFVDDDAMPGLLANALAVPFIPAFEDYGLVAVEAMKSSKPVLTYEDSGGPCELVEDGVSGFVTPPSPSALAARLREICAERPRARAMGEAGLKAVQGINWDAFIAALVGDTRVATSRPPRLRPKITVATTFPVWPPRGGGQARVFHLYRNLARNYDIDIVSFSAPREGGLDREIAPGLREVRIPRSAAHEAGDQAYSAALNGGTFTDLAMPALSPLTPHYSAALRLSAVDSFALIACHPYLVDEVVTAAAGKPVWYEAQDVERDQKQNFAEGGPAAQQLFADLTRVEAKCWREAEMVFACTARDLERLEVHYGPTRALRLEVPNGVALDETRFTDLAGRRQRQRTVGADRTRTALFMGSWHPPNIESVRHILDYAQALPDLSFLIMGSVGLAVKDASLPANVRLLGEVDAPTRQELLATADIALNPTFSGSGTNVKMLDYFGAGIPVVSTRFGSRGIGAENGVHAILTDGDDFIDGLRYVLEMKDENLAIMAANARRLVEDQYSWASIAERLNEVIVQRWPAN